MREGGERGRDRLGGDDEGVIVDAVQHSLQEVGVKLPLLVLDLRGLDAERLLLRGAGHGRDEKVLRQEDHLSLPPCVPVAPSSSLKKKNSEFFAMNQVKK